MPSLTCQFVCWRYPMEWYAMAIKPLLLFLMIKPQHFSTDCLMTTLLSLSFSIRDVVSCVLCLVKQSISSPSSFLVILIAVRHILKLMSLIICRITPRKAEMWGKNCYIISSLFITTLSWLSIVSIAAVLSFHDFSSSRFLRISSLRNPKTKPSYETGWASMLY